MAGGDYTHCEVCGCKVFYDAEVEYDRLGKMIVLCKKCKEKYDIVLKEKEKE